MKRLITSAFIIGIVFVQFCVCPPVSKKKSDKDKDNEKDEVDHLEAIGIEYNRYLKQVVEALESDPDFRHKLENAEEADIRSGKIAEELDYVSHHVRTKLDELKRQELDRLRNLAKMAMEKQNEVDGEQHMDSPHLRVPEHLDHANPNSFEIADLHKLIQKVTSDLAEADKKRRDEFKEYEMQKEFEQHEKLKTMDEDHQKQYKDELEAMKKKHEKHEPLHHPGSKQQLEEVWEKQDHMDNQNFDPKTFFYLHDLDGNGFWDEAEVKALFLKELDKLYQAGVPEDDMRERAEEMERMREHVFRESDTNKDGLISFQEFLEQTKKPEFEKDQGWETLDQQQVYTPEEYAEFERRRQEEIESLIKQGKLPPNPPGMMPQHPGQYYDPNYHGQVPPQQYHHPQQGYQPPHQGYQPPPQGYQQPQQGYQPPQHPQAGQPQYHAQQQPPQGGQYHPQQQQQQGVPPKYHPQAVPQANAAPGGYHHPDPQNVQGTQNNHQQLNNNIPVHHVQPELHRQPVPPQPQQQQQQPVVSQQQPPSQLVQNSVNNVNPPPQNIVDPNAIPHLNPVPSEVNPSNSQPQAQSNHPEVKLENVPAQAQH